MSAYDDNPRAQARAILRMDGADLRTRNEEELATLSSKCLTTWTRAIIRGIKGGTGFKAGNAQRRGCGDNTQDGGLAPPSLVDDDVYYYIRWRLKLEGETENMGVCTKERKGVTAAVLMATPCNIRWRLKLEG